MALASAFSAGPQVRDRPCGKRIGRRGRRSAGRRPGLSWTHGGWPV